MLYRLYEELLVLGEHPYELNGPEPSLGLAAELLKAHSGSLTKVNLPPSHHPVVGGFSDLILSSRTASTHQASIVALYCSRRDSFIIVHVF